MTDETCDVQPEHDRLKRMAYQFFEVNAHDRILTVTINRPERRNALNRSASFELHEIFDDFEGNAQQGVAIITGAGDTAFCAGADLKSEEHTSIEEAVPSSGFGGLVARFDRAKPVIAAVNGFALGGGFEIALACDLIIASETATFGLPEPRVGLVAGSGGIQRLLREVGPKRASALLLTGRRVAALEGIQLGFVNEVVPQAELLATARRYARDILECSPTALRAVKAVANSLDGLAVKESMERMWQLPEVQAVFTSTDSKEGPRAFAERRPPRWSALS
jgi:enoyl-CoA hydratase/carnithine racemase